MTARCGRACSIVRTRSARARSLSSRCTDITTEQASHVGDLILDVKAKGAQPTADSDAAAAKLFKPLARHGAEMQRRHAEVRRTVARYAEAQSARARIASVDVQALPRPSRQGACPCGSGKKYKRCCEPSPVALR